MNWPRPKLPFGKGEIFTPPPGPPKTQPSMERGGPPRKNRTALAYFDDDLPERKVRAAIFRRRNPTINHPTLTQKLVNKLKEPLEFIADLGQGRTIL